MPIEFSKELIDKIAAGSYSDKELASFLESIKKMDRETFLETYRLLYLAANRNPPEKLSPGFYELMEKRLDALEAGKDFLAGNLASPDRGPVTIRRKRKTWYYAAAVLLFLLGAGGYWGFHRRQALQPLLTQQQRFKNDLAPGKNAAVLTLAGGQKIVLDSAGSASLGMQGNTAVENKKGELTYKALHEKPSEILYNTLTTGRGNQYEVVLPDGTKVWLDASSSITYPTAFTGPERKVTITGEAYFEVAGNKSLPFIVAKDGMEVEVLGTHFNINAYGDEPAVRTTLLEGSVKVVKDATEVLLHPGDQVRVRSDGTMNTVKDPDLVESAMAWRNGYFSFDQDDIQTVMRQISRWYNVDVHYKGPPTKALFGGDLGRDLSLVQILMALEKSQVHFILEGHLLTVLP
jgi:ferric-dicitrate binding protein FerR (iron transport regulator)